MDEFGSSMDRLLPAIICEFDLERLHSLWEEWREGGGFTSFPLFSHPYGLPDFIFS